MLRSVGFALVVVGAVGAAACDAANAQPRKRRPAPDRPTASCPDRLVGLWVGRRHDGAVWHEHRISIDQIGSTYTCRQESRSWLGEARDRLPPGCASGVGRAYTVAKLRCGVRVFGAVLQVTSLRLDEQFQTCGDDASGYNLDHLEGEVRGNTWFATNQDGGIDIGAPYAMRRLSCDP
ncbi:MAG: hypothetical protein R3B06_00130 [Kofleriaceae bacterium]